MRVIILTALVLLGGVALTAADRPSRANVTMRDGRSVEVHIFAETVNDVTYTRDPEQSGAIGRFRLQDIAEITYLDPNPDINFARGEGDFNRGNYAAAAGHYANAVQAGRFERVRVAAVLRQADALAAAGKPAEAAQVLFAFAEANPRQRKVVEMLARRADLLRAAKDTAAAAQAYADLGQRARDLGERGKEARALSQLGRGRIAAEAGEHAAAVTAFQAARGEVDRLAQATFYAESSLALVEGLIAQGQQDEAIPVARDLLYLPVDRSLQGAAHLQMARLLADADLKAAFDHAVMSVMRTVGQGETAEAGRALVRQLANRLAEDSELSPTDRRDYRLMPSRL